MAMAVSIVLAIQYHIISYHMLHPLAIRSTLLEYGLEEASHHHQPPVQKTFGGRGQWPRRWASSDWGSTSTSRDDLPGNGQMGILHHFPMAHTHRIHGAAIYGNMDPINIPPMLVYIPAPWILWPIVSHASSRCQDFEIFRMPGLDWAPKGLREIFLQLFTLRGFAAAIQSSAMSSEPTRSASCRLHTESPFFGDEMDPRWTSDTWHVPRHLSPKHQKPFLI